MLHKVKSQKICYIANYFDIGGYGGHFNLLEDFFLWSHILQRTVCRMKDISQIYSNYPDVWIVMVWL